MRSIHEIQKHVGALYKATLESSVNVPLSVQALEWLAFAKDYSAAATLVAEQAKLLMLPRLQLTGQAVELALKACLAASAEQPPVAHNLVELYSLVAARGYSLSESQQAAIVHLSHFYYQDLGTNTKFKARYPAQKAENLGGAVPDDATYVQLVRSLCEQAQRIVEKQR